MALEWAVTPWEGEGYTDRYVGHTWGCCRYTEVTWAIKHCCKSITCNKLNWDIMCLRRQKMKICFITVVIYPTWICLYYGWVIGRIYWRLVELIDSIWEQFLSLSSLSSSDRECVTAGEYNLYYQQIIRLADYYQLTTPAKTALIYQPASYHPTLTYIYYSVGLLDYGKIPSPSIDLVSIEISII